MFYDKLEAPPQPGSLKEALCILVQRYRQEQRYYHLLSTLYAPNTKERQGAFDKFRQVSFPYADKSEANNRMSVRRILDRAYAQGPMTIRKDKK